MSTIRVDVNPEVILDAISKSNRSMEDVEKRFKTFNKWINNELSPTFNQLTDLSKFLRVPFGYLLLSTPVKVNLHA
ncbi:hypothetical protein [Oceanobacillus alkalisoli]|nr:hypothetical protein [Oceanobacillus alkalisoli]MCF3942813.1 hypothetical protein [Oceanobacillus alkalisoli]